MMLIIVIVPIAAVCVYVCASLYAFVGAADGDVDVVAVVNVC